MIGTIIRSLLKQFSQIFFEGFKIPHCRQRRNTINVQLLIVIRYPVGPATTVDINRPPLSSRAGHNCRHRPGVAVRSDWVTLDDPAG